MGDWGLRMEWPQPACISFGVFRRDRVDDACKSLGRRSCSPLAAARSLLRTMAWEEYRRNI